MKDYEVLSATSGIYGIYWGITNASDPTSAAEIVFGITHYEHIYQFGNFYHALGPTVGRWTGRRVRALEQNVILIIETIPNILQIHHDGNLYIGWEGTALSGTNPYNNAEHYDKNYDTCQQLHGLPPGRYTLGLQRSYRKGSSSKGTIKFPLVIDIFEGCGTTAVHIA